MAIHLHDRRHPVKIPVNKLVPATRKHRGGDDATLATNAPCAKAVARNAPQPHTAR